MKQIFLSIIIGIIFLFNPTLVISEKVAGESANITYKDTSYTNKDLFIKKLVIKKILSKYDSLLQNQVDSFIDACVEYQLDCYLLPSITGVESFFAKFIYPQSNNPFGWGKGLIMFENWQSAIKTVAKGLKENYINKGATTVDKIGPIYATSTSWAPKVNYFLSEFKGEEEKIRLLLNNNQVE